MRQEVSTRSRIGPGGERQIVVNVYLVPRGGANRQASADLAQQARTNEDLARHLVSVRNTSNRVELVLRCSPELDRDVARFWVSHETTARAS